jgi:hypothetical protein
MEDQSKLELFADNYHPDSQRTIGLSETTKKMDQS